MWNRIKRSLAVGNLLFRTGKFIRKKIKGLRKKLDFIIGFWARKILYHPARGTIEENKVFLMTYDSAFNCNPRYIAEEMLRRDLPVKIVCVVPNKKGRIPYERFPDGFTLVKRGSFAMFEEMATAKIWIDNALNCVWYGMPKQKGQILINTWHGSLGIKKLGGNRVWMRRAKRCKRLTDYCIANSTFEENVYRETFWPMTPILRYGHARNDILFDSEKRRALKEHVYETLNLPHECRTFLYAPTFRDNGRADAFSVDYERLKETLEEKFGGEWVILVRMHFKNRGGKYATVKFNEWLRNASPYPDMQELLAVVDMGMTDYSSWAYDYILTGNPLFLYAADLDDYDQSRGFYYPLQETPFPLAHDNDELEQAILSFDPADYAQKTARFLQDKGCYEDGHAAERAVDKIESLMGLL